mmetsp:Transcript_178760/g.567238  ORF Transcript_178760/g.567238 Transcript_178760/m.567238 type:complete len:594 (-) Transcript_178760:358-2139(-)
MAGQQPALPAGVHKEVIRHPPTLKNSPPQEGDEVQVHYVLKLKTSELQVDSSRDRGEPFSFKVGQKQVFEGWDLAVRSLRKGEHSRFTIAAPLAYGEIGDEALGVPADSSVILELELLACPAREDLFEDGGAVKLQVKEGSANARQPRRTDEVQISFKVTVQDGGVAMANQHVVYKLGSEQMGLIARVMDKALVSMKRGEEVMITCQPNFAFGSGEGKYAGKVARISLVLEEIFEVYDMSVGDRDKTLLRKRIKEGEGDDKIHDTASVKLLVKSVSANGEKVLQDSRELVFTAGDGEVCDAIDGSVIGMRRGDEAMLRCESVEACTGGLLDLPSSMETPIMIHVAVLSFGTAKEKWDLSSAERIQRGRARKEIAASLFKAGRIRFAAHHYEAIADLFVKLEFFSVEEQKEAAELRRVANLNRAMCLLKMGKLDIVKDLCTSVLKEDASNPKALFRRAKAQIGLREYPEAISDLERLLEVEPASTEGRTLLRETKRLRKQSDSKDSFTFAKMVSGLGDMPERTDRMEDDLVVMPNIDEEFEKLARQHGLPIRAKKAEEAVAQRHAHAAAGEHDQGVTEALEEAAHAEEGAAAAA